MAEFQGDYRGFTFGKLNDNDEYDSNCHSSFYGIVRTSSSNRYEDKLNGTLKDNTQARTNADGTFYFGTTISQKQFTVNFAFDHMTETQLNNMKKWLNPKEIKDLVFDEDNPNITSGRILKKWKAKVTGQTSVKHLCFDENNQRIYKGDGSIQFTCYYPYAFGDEISLANGEVVKGELEIPFIMTLIYGSPTDIPKDTESYIRNISDTKRFTFWFNSTIYNVTKLEWNTKTGLVKASYNQKTDGNGNIIQPAGENVIIPVYGDTLAKLEPGDAYVVQGFTIKYSPQYL